MKHLTDEQIAAVEKVLITRRDNFKENVKGFGKKKQLEQQTEFLMGAAAAFQTFADDQKYAVLPPRWVFMPMAGELITEPFKRTEKPDTNGTDKKS